MGVRCNKCGFAAESNAECNRVLDDAGVPIGQQLNIMLGGGVEGLLDVTMKASHLASRGFNTHGVPCPSCQATDRWVAT